MDIVAGNWGLNSNQRADFERPARLYFGDIGGRGAIDLVETEFSAERDGYIPRRSLTTLSQAAPRLNELYPSHASFGAARLPEMLKPLGASVAEVNASTLATTVFLNRGEFMEAVPLPREAQLAPVGGLGVADLDGDGRQDIFLGQNFFALRPEVSRVDAGCGLVLVGDGRGGFRAASPSQSGIFLLGESRGVAVGDFNEDGRSDLVVAQNGTTTRVLLNNRTGPPGLRVRLWAGAGNPSGYGATVLDAAGAAQQVAAGSGYWSQDGAAVTIRNPGMEPITIRWAGGRTNSYQIPEGSSEVLIRVDSGIKRTR